MSELQSNITVNKPNGKKTTFNFQFDNGLPVKEIVEPEFEMGYAEKEKFYTLSIFLKEIDLNKIKNLQIEGFYSSKKNNDIWLIVDSIYIVLKNINDKIIEEAESKNVAYYFFNEKKLLIKGIMIE